MSYWLVKVVYLSTKRNNVGIYLPDTQEGKKKRNTTLLECMCVWMSSVIHGTSWKQQLLRTKNNNSNLHIQRNGTIWLVHCRNHKRSDTSKYIHLNHQAQGFLATIWCLAITQTSTCYWIVYPGSYWMSNGSRLHTKRVVL